MAEQSIFEGLTGKQAVASILIISICCDVVLGTFLFFYAVIPWIWVFMLVPPVAVTIIALVGYGVEVTLRLRPKLGWLTWVPGGAACALDLAIGHAGISNWMLDMLVQMFFGLFFMVILAMGIYGWWHRPKKVNS